MVQALRKKFFSETVEGHAHSLTFPIYQTGSFLMPDGEKYRYSRELNPTVEELSRIISNFESAEATTCMSSGMGAITTTLLSILKPGHKLLIPPDMFGRTYNFARGFLVDWGINLKVSGIGSDGIISELEDGCTVFLESISNPLLTVYDIEKISRKVHELNGMLIVDSTLPTPYNINPLLFGADLVIHSLSKFMSGHNDLIGGSVSGNEEIISRIDSFRRTLGTSMDPNTAFLSIRGLKTLGIRMETINNHSLTLANLLKSSELFSNIRYPFCQDHGDYSIAKRILYGGSGIVTFDLSQKASSPELFMQKLKSIRPANTFGGVNSTISHPWSMSHRSLSVGEREKIGISPNTIRFSIGLEQPEELFIELQAAASPEHNHKKIKP